MSNPLFPPGWSKVESPFHPGEMAIQEKLGVRERMEVGGRKGIREYMPDQHRDFFASLPFLLVGSVDVQGQPWASILVGQPGFLSSPNPKTLRVHARPLAGDPLNNLLHAGMDIGILGIELPTRRRNRMNGVVSALNLEGFTVSVRQSFGNCPRYIQSREFRFVANPSKFLPYRSVHQSERLTETAHNLISRADTFFIASAYTKGNAGAAKGVDVSHRGGKPGFVRIDNDSTLTTPDFNGNFMFNTLGNLYLNPQAGLLFIDFDGGELLYVTSDAEVIWDGSEVEAFAGAERLVRFHVHQAMYVEGALPLRWSLPDYASELSHTGNWE